MSRITPGRLLTEDERREVLASLALAGETQKSFAAAKGRSYDRLLRMIGRVEIVTPEYARLLNQLVRRHLHSHRAAQAA